jgi:hypothetical protein
MWPRNNLKSKNVSLETDQWVWFLKKYACFLRLYYSYSLFFFEKPQFENSTNTIYNVSSLSIFPLESLRKREGKDSIYCYCCRKIEFSNWVFSKKKGLNWKKNLLQSCSFFDYEYISAINKSIYFSGIKPIVEQKTC